MYGLHYYQQQQQQQHYQQQQFNPYGMPSLPQVPHVPPNPMGLQMTPGQPHLSVSSTTAGPLSPRAPALPVPLLLPPQTSQITPRPQTELPPSAKQSTPSAPAQVPVSPFTPVPASVPPGTPIQLPPVSVPATTVSAVEPSSSVAPAMSTVPQLPPTLASQATVSRAAPASQDVPAQLLPVSDIKKEIPNMDEDNAQPYNVIGTVHFGAEDTDHMVNKSKSEPASRKRLGFGLGGKKRLNPDVYEDELEMLNLSPSEIRDIIGYVKFSR